VSKYHNRRTEADGYTFDSVAEWRRYQDLTLMQRAGLITDLVVHPWWCLVVNGQAICKYVADFQYQENGRDVIEDVKGVRTPAYRIKKALMLACYGISIAEVEA